MNVQEGIVLLKATSLAYSLIACPTLKIELSFSIAQDC